MKNRMLISAFAIFFASYSFANPPADEGKTIFNSRCASCHQVNKVLVGPALAGVKDRHTEDWIIQFVHSSQTVIKSGDAKAIQLYEKFNKIPMPDHPDLTAENIKDILAFIQSESKAPEQAVVFRPVSLRPNYTPISSKNWQFFTGYLFLVFLLMSVLLLLVRIKEIRRKGREEVQ